jgi:hypothetical protein
VPNAKRFVIRLSAACAATAICMSASAAAAVPKGTLTSTEYKQLSIATAALNKSASAKSVNWSKARAACARVGKTTALLSTQRATCFDSVNVLDALASFPAEQRRCPKSTGTTTGTTTTGTTTTGTTTTLTTATPTSGTTTTGSSTTAADSAVVGLMICMSPHYQALARDAKAIDRADISARKDVLARGLSGSCLATLAPTPADLRTVKRFASSTAKLADDVTLLIKVTEGKAPASDFNQAQIDNDVKQFENSATSVLDEHGQQKLSVCPHQ